MDKFGLEGGWQFESHLEKLQEPARSILLDLSNFVKLLGSNVIEEVRPHRIVYAKTLTFRTFLDIEPAVDRLVVSIKSSRSAPPATATVRTKEEAEEIKNQIAVAYEKIQ